MSGEPDVERFLAAGPDAGYGNGCGTDAGSCSCYGYGCGRGSGNVDGSGAGLGYGSGDGLGYGSGDGSGTGRGNGRGNGEAFGSGSCYGSGYGVGADYGGGFGRNLKSSNGQTVYYIDDVPTIINHVVGFYAKGFILHHDLTQTPAFIARVDDCFAHGGTLHAASEEALRKATEARPLEERLAMFKTAFPDPDVECRGEDLFAWHGTLTGSCKQGRLAWCKDHGLDPKATRMTVREFCALTRDAYGGEDIRQLEKLYAGKNE